MAKTLSFAILHFTVVFHFHEKAWKRFEDTTPEQHAKAVNLGWFHAH